VITPHSQPFTGSMNVFETMRYELKRIYDFFFMSSDFRHLKRTV
jgi:hypothetical protein